MIENGDNISKTLKMVINSKNNIYAKCGFKIENFSPEEEGEQYYAHTFTLGGKRCLFRIAKKTPTKSGWFVTIWKRGADSIITPYEEADAIDFVVVVVSNANNVGEFIFPKTVLAKKNIFSANGKEGKRAIRVYTPWDEITSAQAAKTQTWQNDFFVDLGLSKSKDLAKIKDIYS